MDSSERREKKKDLSKKRGVWLEVVVPSRLDKKRKRGVLTIPDRKDLRGTSLGKGFS